MKIIALLLWIVGLSTVSAGAVTPLDITTTGKTITSSNGVVAFSLANPGVEAASTNVFSLQGKWVAELTARSIGTYVWDGKDVDQQPVESGLYVVQIRHHGSVWHSPVLVNR